jgi:hypothetical protein
VHTKPVHLSKPVNPQPMRKTHLTQSYNIHKSPSVLMSSELPISMLHFSSCSLSFLTKKPHFFIPAWAPHSAASRANSLACEGKDLRPGS